MSYLEAIFWMSIITGVAVLGLALVLVFHFRHNRKEAGRTTRGEKTPAGYPIDWSGMIDDAFDRPLARHDPPEESEI